MHVTITVQMYATGKSVFEEMTIVALNHELKYVPNNRDCIIRGLSTKAKT